MIRVGAVSYLNTRPLVCGLQDRLRDELPGGGELLFDLPSRLADRLAASELDVALIPSIEYFRGRDYRVVSDVAIACRGPVWSVRLLSRVPVAEIRTLAMDEGSRTSQALARVLLWEQFRLRPETRPFPITAAAEEVDADALLMIGDRAMHPTTGVYREIWDLGDRWCRWSELPFVFAVWVARAGVDVEPLTPILEGARDEGLQKFEQIAEAEAGPLGLTTSDCVAYFARNLHFHLGPAERRGLELFRERAAALDLAPVAPVEGG
ncbi:menaquinone biosynthetic enzyme MqnA/MqnD family protein [Candidatus Laterigemmans baculatus]|uniref:menaquinone biosynthetic enzyme MqnA/MqnD family protein n=1 Tax=Candidatus Laterigemmans baculatus TaxID=2770505 RepID=UPI0013DADC83|nr:menaquinone biosynthesis protein [Candidatus Laterigemmans baculatus]